MSLASVKGSRVIGKTVLDPLSRMDDANAGRMDMKKRPKTIDLETLSKALERLPEDLVYLTRPIMEAAAIDPEEINVGLAQIPSFDAIWKERAEEMGANAAMQQAGEHATRLGMWLRSLQNPNAPWLGPVWAIEGMLYGCAMYGVPDEEHAAAAALARQEAHGDSRFSRIDLDVPEGMKSRHSQDGWELTDDQAQIFIREIPAEAFEIFSMQLNIASNLGASGEELGGAETDFCVGEVSGIRVVQRLRARVAPGALYLLTVPGGHVEVRVTSRLPGRQLDLAKYEAMIGSIRCE